MTTLEQAARKALSVIDQMEQNYGNLWQVNASPEELDALCTELRDALEQPQPARREQRMYMGEQVFVEQPATRRATRDEKIVKPGVYEVPVEQLQEERPSLFDHKTAANFLSGREVDDESMRRFVAASRWAHDDNRSLRTVIEDLRREIAARDAEIALLKDALMQAEQPQQEPDPAARNGWVLREVLFDNGEPVGHREPQQEPVAWFYEERGRRWVTDALHEAQHANDGVITPLYTAPQPRKRLTDEELGKIINANWGVGVWQMGRAIEAAHGITGEQK